MKRDKLSLPPGEARIKDVPSKDMPLSRLSVEFSDKMSLIKIVRDLAKVDVVEIRGIPESFLPFVAISLISETSLGLNAWPEQVYAGKIDRFTQERLAFP